MSFIPTVDILAALKVAIVALQLPAQYSSVSDYPKAFTAVEIYAREDLTKAFDDLYLQDDRACFIVPGGDDHQNVIEGRIGKSHRSTEVHLLLSDRDYNRAQSELVGGAEAPGVITLKDLIVNSLMGANLGLRGVFLLPTNGTLMVLSDKEQENAPGRAGWAQSFTTSAGIMKAGIPR
jgi:hypothetical protein